MKSSMGRGIELLLSEQQLPDYGEWLVQEYIDQPHLINDRKYTLRLFLLITNTAPLTAYLYQDGTVDLAVKAYSTEKSRAQDPGIHIANGALQSTLTGFNKKEHSLDLNQWREHINKVSDASHVWAGIEAVLKETLCAISNPLREASMEQLAHSEQCFEILGIDIMLDDKLKPWLIECNRTPSMTPEYTGGLKPSLLKDTLGLILGRRQALIAAADKNTCPQPLIEFGGYKRIL
jgi:tubulin polyglutamylase TTLL5